ncbi:MAG: hypothetical protein KA765_15505 [Thermoflexales bacterium]|nr:hypothetical protein [Thermoflexales bacterium]
MTTLSHIDRFIPLAQAAKRLGITASSLKKRVASGNVRAASLNGTLAVAESELNQIISISRDQFKHLRGESITIAQAAQNYDIHPETIRGWVNHGYIRILREGYGKELDLADVEYCVAIYRAQGGGRGKRLFDDQGQPYQPKQTEWAAYQRERRKKNKAAPLTTTRPQR